MKKNEFDFFEWLNDIDDETLEIIAEKHPFPDKFDNDTIERLCEEKLAMKNNNDFYAEDVVNEPVERIKKTPWYRSHGLSIAASLVVIAGLGAVTFSAFDPGESPLADVSVSEDASEEDAETEFEEVSIMFSLDIPEGETGRYSLSFGRENIKDEEYTFEELFRSGIIYCEDTDSVGFDISDIGIEDGEEITVYLTNEDDPTRCGTLGKYKFDISTGECTTVYEDIEKAFSDAKAESDDDGTLIFTLNVPERAEGTYYVKFVDVKENGDLEPITETEFEIAPEAAGESQATTLSFSFDQLEGKHTVDLYISDEPTDGYLAGTAIMGRYTFDFDDGTYTTVFEDAQIAFDIADGIETALDGVELHDYVEVNTETYADADADISETTEVTVTVIETDDGDNTESIETVEEIDG